MSQTEELRKDALIRARELGASFQKFTAWANGGGLTATYVFAGNAIQSNGFSASAFLAPASCFAFGILLSGGSLLRSLWTQRYVMDTVDGLFTKPKGEATEDEELATSRKLLAEMTSKTRVWARATHLINFAAMLAFAGGMAWGLTILVAGTKH